MIPTAERRQLLGFLDLLREAPGDQGITHDAGKIFQAVGWGLLSGSALLLGCIISLTCMPGQRVRAILMAFGGGALLEALSIELYQFTFKSKTTKQLFKIVSDDYNLKFITETFYKLSNDKF